MSVCVFSNFQWLKFCYEQLETPATVLTWLNNGTLTREQVPALVESPVVFLIPRPKRKLGLTL